MNTFGAIDTKDYNTERFYASAPLSWQLVSSSLECEVLNPENLNGAITINRATNIRPEIVVSSESPINLDTGIYEYVLYSSIKTNFYNNRTFPTSGLAPLTNDSYVVSIGQDFYADRIMPSSFTLKVNNISNIVFDDGKNNLIVSESGTGSYVGRIFYEKGIAVLNHLTSSLTATVTGSGIKIVNGSNIYVDYNSDVEIIRHQINVKLAPAQFNFVLLNPSMERGFTPTGSFTESIGAFTASMIAQGIPPYSENTWSLFRLMGSDNIRPYVSTIGLYNDQYELLAIAKLSTPIQRTFESQQIFIVRFDT